MAGTWEGQHADGQQSACFHAEQHCLYKTCMQLVTAILMSMHRYWLERRRYPRWILCSPCHPSSKVSRSFYTAPHVTAEVFGMPTTGRTCAPASTRGNFSWIAASSAW